jgi:hypothetical protein
MLIETKRYESCPDMSTLWLILLFQLHHNTHGIDEHRRMAHMSVL